MTRPRPIARLKVTLADVEPKVVRRVDVPLKIRLDRLHLVMQAAMGWTNSHLFAFTVGGTSWGVADPDFDDDTLPASEVTLSDLVEDTGTRTFHYLYDFGDDWDHVVRLERVFDADPLERYPQLVMAEGRCPPEDDDPSEDGSSVHEMARVSKTREGWTTRLRRVPSGHRRSRPRGARASPRLVWWLLRSGRSRPGAPPRRSRPSRQALGAAAAPAEDATENLNVAVTRRSASSRKASRATPPSARAPRP